MNCSQIEEYASLYIDGMLTEEEMINFNKHLKTCESCSISVENLRTLVTTVNEMEEVDLPANFGVSLREKLQQEQVNIQKSNKKKGSNENKGPIPSWKILSSIAAGFMIVAMSMTLIEDVPFNSPKMAELAKEGYGVTDQVAFDVGRSTENSNSSSFTTSTGAVEEEKAKAESTESLMVHSSKMADTNENASLKAPQEETTMMMSTENRKIINKGRLYLETNEFDAVIENVHSIVEGSGGYYQSSDVQYNLLSKENPEDSLRTSYLTIRVPKDHFDRVFAELKGLGIIINENTSAEDITLNYRDMENEVLNLEVQEERLREILKKAVKVDDILRIENELARVRGQINNLKGNLKNYDQLVTLSTIDLEIREVKEQEMKIHSVNEGVWSEAQSGFVKSINQIIDFVQRSFIKLYSLIPWGIVATMFILPSVKLYDRFKKRRKNIEK